MSNSATGKKIRPKTIETIVAQRGLVSIRQGRRDFRGLGGHKYDYIMWRERLLDACRRSE